jgi:MoaA/NifB/PqqE/SkfB family radical SAM enzyme
MLSLDQIKSVHVELTTRCNARCPMCPRNYRGLDYNSGYPITELSLQQFKHIFSPEFLQQLKSPAMPNDGFQHVYHGANGISFNGNLGDFGLARDALEIVHYLVEHQVNVHINTNGSMRSPDWWAQLAGPGVTIGFAIDGLEDTHHLYRQDTDWKKIIQNARAFIAAGGQAVWRFVPFDHNQHQEEQCKQLAKEYGFIKFENIYDGRNTGPAFTRVGEFSHQIGKDPGAAPGAVPDIKPLLENHITWYDAKTVNETRDRPKLNIDCLHKRNREIYITADGSVYPCCFLGFYPGQMHHPGNQELTQLVSENNALEYSLEHCVQWFNQVEETWKLNSVAQGRTYQCVKTCGRP